MRQDIRIDLLTTMLRIRRVEEEIAARYNKPPRPMHTPIHLYEGQEAVASGVCANLLKDDIIFSNHRDHGHYLAKGGDLKKLIAELYCKETGCCRGKGGSMHLCDMENGISVSSAIVAGNIGVATGCALAMKNQGKSSVAVAFMGDGATEEGSVYESLCFAQLYQLPILYVVENNFYAINTPLPVREFSRKVTKKFSGIINADVYDGNDVEVVYSSSQEHLSAIRAGQGPQIVEFLTYRTRAHSNTGDGESHVRSREEIEEWKKHDPIDLIINRLIHEDAANSKKIQTIVSDINNEIMDAFDFAEYSPFPEDKEVFEDVFA